MKPNFIIIIIFGILILLGVYLTVDINNNHEINTTPVASLSNTITTPKNINPNENSGNEDDVKQLLIARGSDKLLETLDELTARGISGNSKNIDELDIRFRTSNNREEKLRFARLYNAAYFGTEDSLVRERISKTISDLLKAETDPAVGRALALSHSRLLFNEQTKENLNFAHKSKFLSNDDYYGELAHIMPGTLAITRSQIVNEIAVSHNPYASEIVADFIANSENIEFTKEEAASLYKYLTEIEPTFSGLPSNFGMIDAIRYEQWLRAVAYLESKNTSSSVDLIIINRLTSTSTDPRAAVAFLVSPYAEILLKQEKYKSYMSQIRQNADKFIAQYSSESALQQAGVQIAQLFLGK